MSWFILIIAGLFEVAFVITMKLSEGFRNKKYTVSYCFVRLHLVSFYYQLP